MKSKIIFILLGIFIIIFPLKPTFSENKCPKCQFINNKDDRICINCLHEIKQLTDMERKRIQYINKKLLEERHRKIDDQIKKSLPYIKIRNLNASYRPLMDALSRIDESMNLKETHIEKLTREIEKVFGFKIYYRLNKDFKIPSYSLKNGTYCEQSTWKDIVRIYTILDEFFSAYSRKIIGRHIQNIYIVQNYKDHRGNLYGIAFSNTSSFWVSTKSRNKTISKKEYLKTFHHEFNHLLYFKNKSSFNKQVWTSYNPKDFKYIGSDHKTIKIPKSKINQMGFVRAYGMSNILEDLATYSEFVFCQPDRLISMSKKHKAIKGKFKIIVEWYTKLGVEFQFPKSIA